MQITLDEATREELAAWTRQQKAPVGLVRRAQAIWRLAAGESFAATARAVGMRVRHVRKWAARFVAEGLAGLQDRARSGRRFFPPAVALHVVKLACERPEEQGRSLSQWDAPDLAPVLRTVRSAGLTIF